MIERRRCPGIPVLASDVTDVLQLNLRRCASGLVSFPWFCDCTLAREVAEGADEGSAPTPAPAKPRGQAEQARGCASRGRALAVLGGRADCPSSFLRQLQITQGEPWCISTWTSTISS